MRLNISYFSILVLSILIGLQSCGQSTNNQQPETLQMERSNGDEQAISTLKEFYTLYISNSCADIVGNYEVMDSLETRYMTRQLRDKLDTAELDYDPVLNAQDCDEGWINTLEITKMPDRENNYEVCYGGDEFKNCIRLTLIKVDGEYRINDILSGEE